MSDYIAALPPEAYNIEPNLATFERSGKDGNEVIMPIFGGDNFVGEVLGGKWVKGDDGEILGPHTQLISGGELQITGKSHSAGNEDACWVRSKSKTLLREGTVIDVHLKLPSHSAANFFWMGFMLCPSVPAGVPQSENDYLYCAIYTNTTTYTVYVIKKVGGVATTLLDGETITNAEGTFRLKFKEQFSGYTNVYFHDGSGAVDESTDEVLDSPYNLSLNFTEAYPIFMLDTSETTNRTVVSEGVIVSYPFGSNISQLIKYDAPRGDRSGTESLYAEAEDCTLGGGADKENLADDVNWSARLNAQNEYVTFDLNPVTDYLSRGRYLALILIKDTAQIADDVQLRAYNVTDSTYMNIENALVTKTAEGTFKVFELIFDVTAEDASDSCQLRVLKSTATANTIYVDWFRVVPYDGVNGNCAVYDTKIEESEAGWLEGWRKRTKFTIPAALLDDDLTWFPFLVYLSSSSGTNSVDMTRVFDELGDNRLKIAITTSDGLTQLYGEVNYWSSAQGICEVWCSKDGFTLSDSSDNEFYLYYDKEHDDNTAYVGVAGSTPAQQVWNTDFKFRSSMSDDPDTSHIKDSTSNGNDGTKLAANEPIETTGQIGKAPSFDGIGDWISVPRDASLEPTHDFSLSVWATLSDVTGWKTILNHRYGDGYYIASSDAQLYFGVHLADGYLAAYIANVFEAGVPVHISLILRNDNKVYIYKNGNLIHTSDAQTGDIVYPDDVFKIGLGPIIGDAYFKGKIDEIQLYADDWSSAWVSASYLTQTDSLISWGAEETAEWTQVYSSDHNFVGDLVANNGLSRIVVDEKAQYGLMLKCWLHAGWTHPLDRLSLYLASDAKELSYPFLRHISTLSSEEVCFDVRLEDSAVQDGDYYADLRVTLKRGNPYIQLEVLEVYPIQDSRFKWLNSTALRFGYVGDAETHEVGDDDLDQTANNTTLSDNFLVAFDNAGSAVLAFVAANIQPDSRFQASDGGDLIIEDYTTANLKTAKIFVGILPFSRVASLFAEAEDETISAAARLNLDGEGEDTVTENNGVWAATTNCAVDENVGGAHVSVGSVCTSITSSGAGLVQADCTPATPLKLTKFDFLKVYLNKAAIAPNSVIIEIFDADGDSVEISQAIDATLHTQYSIALPHSSGDLQGWTENGTYDFSTAPVTYRMEWTAAGGAEVLIVDGLHLYIGTTTSRGRGETLSGGSAVVLDADEELSYDTIIVGGETLPKGRYLLLARAKDTEQIADDFRMNVRNNTDGVYVHESNDFEGTWKTLTASFAYYQLVFDIADSDLGDNLYLRCYKRTASENTIFVDYFLIVPIGNGESLPQDLAHNAMRKIGSQRRPVDRREAV